MPTSANAKILLISGRGSSLRGLLNGVSDQILDWDIREDVSHALGDWSELNPDLIIADGPTLHHSQLALVPALQSLATGTPLLLISTTADAEDLRRSFQLGATAVILDPFDLEQARSALAAAFAEPEDRRPATEWMEELATFLRGAAHEILNPLTSISGLAQVLLAEVDEDISRKKRYRMMLHETDRIQRTLQQIESFVRRSKPRKESVAVQALLQGIAAQSGPIELEVQGSPTVLGDGDQLKSAVGSLVRFASAGESGAAPVRMRAGESNGSVVVEIRGPRVVSIPEPAERFFVPYYDPSGAGRIGGLELAASYGIVRAHGGKLRVAPAPEGGVRFRAELPRAQEKPFDSPRNFS